MRFRQVRLLLLQSPDRTLATVNIDYGNKFFGNGTDIKVNWMPFLELRLQLLRSLKFDAPKTYGD